MKKELAEFLFMILAVGFAIIGTKFSIANNNWMSFLSFFMSCSSIEVYGDIKSGEFFKSEDNNKDKEIDNEI